MAKPKRIRIVTPQGVAKFPYLTTPDTQFNSDGEYKVNIILDPADPDVQPFLDRLDELATEAVEKAKTDLIAGAKTPKLGERAAEAVIPQEPYREDLDSEGEPTGKIEVRFKTRARGTRKDGSVWTRTVNLFDAKGKPLGEGVAVYGGAVIKVNFTPNPYYVAGTKAAGISLQLNAVQVLELSSGADASFYGFSSEEGFDSEDDAASSEGSNDDGGEEDF